MNDPSVSPAPLVEHALASLRDKALERAPASRPAAAQTQAKPAPETQAEPAPETQAEPDHDQVKRDPPQIQLDVAQTQVETNAPSSVELDQPRGGASVSLDSAMEALRTVSVSAQTRLADPEEFAELPVERDLSDLGPYVEHVMREAQAAAAAYRQAAERETTARAAKLLDAAAASAEKIHQDADAYGERAVAQADALLAERVHRIAELTGRLSQMAQRAGGEFAADQMMRDQIMQFISALTAVAEEAITDVFPNTSPSSDRPQAGRARPRRKARP